MPFKNIHYLDYVKLRRQYKPTIIDDLKKFPKEGLWLPISQAAYFLGYSKQLIHALILTKQIKALKMPIGPMLVNIHEIQELEQADSKLVI